jgi:ABC-type glycerol-3-phosphate transport system permease component
MTRPTARLSRIFLYLILTVFCCVVFFPFYWMITTSLQNFDDLFRYPPKLIPSKEPIGAYAKLIRDESQILRWLFNSFLVSTVACLFSTLFAIPGAYSISRFRYKGKTFFIFIILLTQMLPPVFLIIPVYIIFSQIGLINTLLALMVIYTTITVPIGVWFLKGFIDSVPEELEESAIVDGCSRIQALRQILLPLIVPGIIATASWSYIIAWNEYLFAFTLAERGNLWVVSVGLAAYIGEYSTPWDQIMGGAAIATLPVVFLFMFFQRYIVSGLTAGAVKE